MALKARIDELQRGHTWSAFPYAVVKKFGEDSSSNLAVLITYYLFFSIFPLLLALFSVLGYVLAGHPSWIQKVKDSALQEFPLIKGPLPEHGSVIIVVVGVVLALYSGLGVAKAAQSAWDTVYGVPKGDRPGFVPKNLRALRLVAVGGVSLIATTVASSLVASASEVGLHVGPWLSVLSLAVTLALNALVFAVLFRWLTVRDLSFRDVWPGAVVSAVALEVLQTLASAFIAHKLKGAKATYGSFGTVIVLLSWFYLQSQMLLLAAQINVVRSEHLWPRSLDEGLDSVLTGRDLARAVEVAVPDHGVTAEASDPVVVASRARWQELADRGLRAELALRAGLGRVWSAAGRRTAAWRR